MKKLFTFFILSVAGISAWAHTFGNDNIRFDSDCQTEQLAKQGATPLFTISRSAATPAGGAMQQCPAIDKIQRKAPRAQAATQDAGTHLGYITQDKLEYALFRFDEAQATVATLIGWADSYDYYPNIVVPDNVNFNGLSVPVTAINDYAFINGWGITGLTLGKNIIFIGIQAFAGCSIKDLSIPESVAQIMPYAFNACAITSINFEDASSTATPLTIGWGAFSYTSFKSIEIPARLVVNGTNSFLAGFCNPFGENLSLETITINPNFDKMNRDYSLEINQGVLCSRVKPEGIDAEYVYVIACPPARTIDEFNLAADFIGVFEDAFADCKINKIALNSALEIREGKININIGYNAFYYSEISSLNISANGPIRLQYGFTDGCRFLKTYNLSESITNYNVADGVIYSKKDNERYLDFYPCGRSDASFTIPSDVMHLTAGSFNSNPYVEEISLPSGLKTIGERAFRNCINLERLVYTGNNIASIGQEAFDLTKINTSAPQGEIALGNWLIGYSGDVPSNLIISEKINHAVSGIFANNTSISSVTFPKDFEDIPKEMFRNCTNLTNIQFSENLKTIGEYAFFAAGYTAAQSSQSRAESTLIISEGVASIGTCAFANSSVADKLVLPSSVQYIENMAFATKRNLLEVEIHRATPPESENRITSIFSDRSILNGTLLIPKDADPLAFTGNPYWNFSKVINGDFASIDNAEIATGEIIVSPGSISSADNAIFNLYNADGRFIGTGSSFTNLPRGIYIVQLGTAVLKRIVR